ncbi:MAG: SH3 domain-containing protein [Lachnospiraceae bacterium]|nr:SH3 domain-containing protein [Lachnospiraceae bacterium]
MKRNIFTKSALHTRESLLTKPAHAKAFAKAIALLLVFALILKPFPLAATELMSLDNMENLSKENLSINNLSIDNMENLSIENNPKEDSTSLENNSIEDEDPNQSGNTDFEITKITELSGDISLFALCPDCGEDPCVCIVNIVICLDCGQDPCECPLVIDFDNLVPGHSDYNVDYANNTITVFGTSSVVLKGGYWMGSVVIQESLDITILDNTKIMRNEGAGMALVVPDGATIHGEGSEIWINGFSHGIFAAGDVTLSGEFGNINAGSIGQSGNSVAILGDNITITATIGGIEALEGLAAGEGIRAGGNARITDTARIGFIGGGDVVDSMLGISYGNGIHANGNVIIDGVINKIEAHTAIRCDNAVIGQDGNISLIKGTVGIYANVGIIINGNIDYVSASVGIQQNSNREFDIISISGRIGGINAVNSAISGVGTVDINGTVGNIIGNPAIISIISDIIISGSVGNIKASDFDSFANAIYAPYGSISIEIDGSVGNIDVGLGICLQAGENIYISGTVGQISGTSLEYTGHYIPTAILADSFTIANNSVVYATGVSTSDGFNQVPLNPTHNSQGILFTGGKDFPSGRVYGDVTLRRNLVLQRHQSLSVPSGNSLTIPQSIILTNNGTLNNSGTILNHGTIDSRVDGVRGSGVLVGGAVRYRSNTPPQSVPPASVTEKPEPAPAKSFYTVNATYLNERSGPGTGFPLVGRLARGTVVEIIEFSPDGEWVLAHTGTWLSVNYLNHLSGPVRPLETEASQERVTAYAVNISPASRLFVRNAPGMNGRIVGTLRAGDIVRVTGLSNGWAAINYTSGIPTAYVAARYLQEIDQR